MFPILLQSASRGRLAAWHLIARRLPAAVLAAALASPARAQGATETRVPEHTRAIQLSGPRFGVTMLSQAMVDSLAAHNVKVGRVISQFGWQFEHQFLNNPTGLEAVTEWVVLVGGLDQGTFLPSLSWLVGLRSPGGVEFGVGPNLSVAGVALVGAAGVTYQAGAVNIPLNVAVAPSKDGARVSVITGFTMNR